MLQGWDPKFVGVVEVQEDGVGVWSFGGKGDSTCVANVNDLTFNGKYRLQIRVYYDTHRLICTSLS